MSIDFARHFEKPKTLHDIVARARMNLSGKIGRCPYCMRSSALGTLLGWVAVALAMAVGELVISLIALAIAVAFTTLLLLHVTVLTVRVMRWREKVSDEGRSETQGPRDLSRRHFLATSAKVGATAFAAALAEPVYRGIAMAVGREADHGNSPCAKLCRALFPPGPDRGRCISEGAQGRGICFEGFCIPAPAANSQFKPKQSREEKLQTLLQNNPTSSSLAGNFFHTARRFLGNQAPANQLETRMFPAFAALPETTKQMLQCSVNRFDSLPRDDRVTLFGEPFADTDLQPISTEDLSRSLRLEFDTLLLADSTVPPLCDPETPGLARPLTYIEIIDGGSFTEPVPWIDRLANRRTRVFLREGGGFLALADYTEDEIEQSCQPDPGPPPTQICEVTTPPCPGEAAGFFGYEVEDVCLRVSTFVSGDTVTLEGVNFYDVNARVRLTNQLNDREAEARVCGDTETPLTDPKGAVIADSRVKDILGFTIPEDLPDGIYEVSVIVTNPNGTEYVTPLGYRPVIRVLAPFNGRFQITTGRLRCNSETFPVFPGSDEVGIQIIATPIRLGQVVVDPTTRAYRFGDVDSGENREMISTAATGGSRLLLDVQATPDLIGVIFTIAGYEIDSNDAYQDAITSFWDLYVQFLQEELLFLAAILGPIGAWFGVSGVANLIGAHPILAAIASAVILAIPVFIALWAPADPIMEDHIALSVVDLLEMTSVSFPLPFRPPYTSPVTYSQGIEVEVTSAEKAPGELREQRRHHSSEEDSTYTLELVYNRSPALIGRTPGIEIASTGMVSRNGGAKLVAEKSTSRPPFTFQWQAADHAGDPKFIRIFDVAGRERAQVKLSAEKTGLARWDGSDHRDTALPAGVYFAVLSGGAAEARARIVLLR